VSDQPTSRARGQVRATRIEVTCRDHGTHLSLDNRKPLRDQISAAVFAHERQCGRCDTREAYTWGSPDFLTIQDPVDEKRTTDG